MLGSSAFAADCTKWQSAFNSLKPQMARMEAEKLISKVRNKPSNYNPGYDGAAYVHYQPDMPAPYVNSGKAVEHLSPSDAILLGFGVAGAR